MLRTYPCDRCGRQVHPSEDDAMTVSVILWQDDIAGRPDVDASYANKKDYNLCGECLAGLGSYLRNEP